MARLPGVSSAPPTPWTMRAAMRRPAVGAKPQQAEATANQTHADGEDAPPPEAVAERAAEKEEGGQGQRVAGDHPLQGPDAAAERAADGGEGDADDRRIERGDARAEDGGREHPAPAAGVQGERRVPGAPSGAGVAPDPLTAGSGAWRSR